MTVQSIVGLLVGCVVGECVGTVVGKGLGFLLGDGVGGGTSVGMIDLHPDAGPKQLSFGPLGMTM
jgi:hypothetical protein